MRATQQLLAALAIMGLAGSALAYDPYTPVPGGVIPSPGLALPAPFDVDGKELSFDLDHDAPPPGPGLLVPDPEQNVFWDADTVATPPPGLIGGADYSGSRPGPSTAPDQDRQVDALAYRFDALFEALNLDATNLIYSVDVPLPTAVKPISPATPVYPPIGGPLPGDVQFELTGAPVHGLWAAQPVDINTDTRDPILNVDALEVWGPEVSNPQEAPAASDANYYSLRGDAFTPGGFSVWNYDSTLHSSTGYVTQGVIAGAVASLLGSLPSGVDDLQIELDALMMQDLHGEETRFDIGDKLYFSIEQIADPTDADGFYATGSEIFILEMGAAGPTASFLFHGGHLWDHTWTLDNMAFFDGQEFIQLDVDAIEAVSTPEPGTIALLVIGGMVALRRRRAG